MTGIKPGSEWLLLILSYPIPTTHLRAVHAMAWQQQGGRGCVGVPRCLGLGGSTVGSSSTP